MQPHTYRSVRASYDAASPATIAARRSAIAGAGQCDKAAPPADKKSEESKPVQQRRWIRTNEAAEHTNQGKSTLDKLRMTGGGPPYVKRGSVVLYDRDDLDRWLEERKVRSTSEPVKAV